MLLSRHYYIVSQNSGSLSTFYAQNMTNILSKIARNEEERERDWYFGASKDCSMHFDVLQLIDY